MNVNILALDSASTVCSVAILRQDSNQAAYFRAEHEGTAKHAEQMLPLIETVLTQSALQREELSAIAFAQGPGGFTGLRVACGVAQGLAYALGVPVIPVSSLLVIAAQQPLLPSNPSVIELVATDARMQELYVGAYQRISIGWYSFHKPILIEKASFYQYVKQLQQQQKQLGLDTLIRVSGDALDAFEGMRQELIDLGVTLGVKHKGCVDTLARLAQAAFEQGRGCEPALAAPLYVRNHVAYTIAERELGMGGNPAAHWQAPTFRAMAAEDLTQVAAIEQQVQLDPWRAEQFAQSLEAGHSMWVAESQQQIIAYAVVMNTVEASELLIIGVAPTYQRQGVAQQLLCFIEQQVRAVGSKEMHLEVRVSNYAAIQLYQGADYVQVGLRKNYYLAENQMREDAALYTKQLA